MDICDSPSTSIRTSCTKPVRKHNAMKQTRNIEIGLIHEGRALRKASGGGTRKIIMNKTCDKNDICENVKTFSSRMVNLCKVTSQTLTLKN